MTSPTWWSPAPAPAPSRRSRPWACRPSWCPRSTCRPTTRYSTPARSKRSAAPASSTKRSAAAERRNEIFLPADAFFKTIEELLAAPGQLAAMRQNLLDMDKPDSTAIILDAVEGIIGKKSAGPAKARSRCSTCRRSTRKKTWSCPSPPPPWATRSWPTFRWRTSPPRCASRSACWPGEELPAMIRVQKGRVLLNGRRDRAPGPRCAPTTASRSRAGPISSRATWRRAAEPTGTASPAPHRTRARRWPPAWPTSAATSPPPPFSAPARPSTCSPPPWPSSVSCAAWSAPTPWAASSCRSSPACSSAARAKRPGKRPRP